MARAIFHSKYISPFIRIRAVLGSYKYLICVRISRRGDVILHLILISTIPKDPSPCRRDRTPDAGETARPPTTGMKGLTSADYVMDEAAGKPNCSE
jgi:hypothetical protein